MTTTQESSADQIDFFNQESAADNFSKEEVVVEPVNKGLDLSLKLSLEGQNAAGKALPLGLTRSSTIGGELTVIANCSVPCLDRSSSLPVEAAKKGLVRFGDLQAMRRLETGKRWLQEKLKKAEMPPAASPGDPLKHEGSKDLAEGGAISSIQTSAIKGKEILDYPKPTDKDLPPSPADDTKPENPSKKPRYSGPGPLKGDDMEILKKMPSVSTTGNGGRRIKGFLYSYTKSEICIVCVCHGSFFTPEEFVMHAGGKGVENPMKHIIVSSKSF